MRVLLTGPGGRIGPHILPLFSSRFDLRILDKGVIPGYPDAILADLSDISVLQSAMQDIETVVHLAATSDEAPFIEQLVPNNIIGVYNLYEAARLSGVKRVVFASTVQTIGFYPKEHIVQVDEPPRPVSLYGATKVFGETLGQYYYDKFQIETVAVRIGWFQDYDSKWLRSSEGARMLWLSPRDAAEILARAAEMPGLGFARVFATSKTSFERLSLAPLRTLLNYEPLDNIATINAAESE